MEPTVSSAAANSGNVTTSKQCDFPKIWVNFDHNPGVVNHNFFNNSPVFRSGETPSISKPAVVIEALTSIEPQTLDDSFVYVHCYFRNKGQNMLIRIWKTTFLIDGISGTRSKLVHVENITMAPVWTRIPDETTYSFLLIFSGLPKSCQQFDLVEEIPEPGGFHITNISRNQTDVYHIDLSS